MQVSFSLKQKLKQLILERTGNPLTNMHDAELLSASMAQKKLLLSAHTIARLFGILAQDRKHYRHTYDHIAHFLNFKDWNHLHSFLQDAPASLSLQTYNDQFPIPFFKIALSTDDHFLLFQLLDAFEPEKHTTIRFQLANIIGQHIKAISPAKQLLSVLAQHPHGRYLFFETFVDEDNTSDYYSHALENFYLPHLPNENDKIFVDCYLFTNQLYSGKNKGVEFPKKHFENLYHLAYSFHQTSRLWECYFLHYIPKQTKATLHRVIDEMLSYATPFSLHDKSYLLGRFIRAFLYHQKAHVLLSHKPYMQKLAQINQDIEPSHYTMANYLIQTFLLYSKSYAPTLQEIRLTPDWDFFNETHHKMLLDALVYGYLENDTTKKSWMNQYILQSGQMFNKNWMQGFLLMDSSPRD